MLQSMNEKVKHERNFPTTDDLIRALHKENHPDMAEKIKKAVDDFHNRGKNDVLKDKLNATTELLHVYSNYINITRDITQAFMCEMPYIPFSEWVKQLDCCMFTDEHDGPTKEIVASLKSDLRQLATSYKYTTEDHNGYLISGRLFEHTSNKETENDAESDETVKEIRRMLKDAACIKMFSEMYRYDVSDLMQAKVWEWKERLLVPEESKSFDDCFIPEHMPVYEYYKNALEQFFI